MVRTPAWKRYNWRVIWLSLLYVAFLLRGLRVQTPAGAPAAAYFVAILPALPIIGIFGALGRYLVEEQDEYVRMLMVRQVLWASGLTLSIATAWGFLDNFGLVGHADGYWLIAIWFAGLGLGGIVNKLTLGDGGC